MDPVYARNGNKNRAESSIEVAVDSTGIYSFNEDKYRTKLNAEGVINEAEIATRIVAERERLAEKKRRKEINTLKSGGYEIIQNTQKIKKWKRKARKMLQKLPPELFYEKAK